MANYSIGNYRLQVIQGSQSDSVMLLNNKLLSMRSNADNYTTLLREESEKKSRLQAELQQYTRFKSLSPAVAKEMKALYPAVSTLSLSVANEAVADSTSSRNYVLAVVRTRRRSAFNEQERTKIRQWLSARLQADSLEVIIQ